METPRIGPRIPYPVRATLIVGATTAVTVGFFTLPLDRFGPDDEGITWLLQGVLLALLAAAMVATTIRALTEGSTGQPGGAILLLSWTSILVFASWYYAMSKHPGEMSGLKTRVDALYFTVITMTTVGYGDITPTGQTPRVVVMIQLAYSFAFLAAGLTAMTTRIRKRVIRKLGL